MLWNQFWIVYSTKSCWIPKIAISSIQRVWKELTVLVPSSTLSLSFHSDDIKSGRNMLKTGIKTEEQWWRICWKLASGSMFLEFADYEPISCHWSFSIRLKTSEDLSQNVQTYSKNSSAIADELFECIWPFCERFCDILGVRKEISGMRWVKQEIRLISGICGQL